TSDRRSALDNRPHRRSSHRAPTRCGGLRAALRACAARAPALSDPSRSARDRRSLAEHAWSFPHPEARRRLPSFPPRSPRRARRARHRPAAARARKELSTSQPTMLGDPNMMKRAILFLLVFAACDQATGQDNPAPKKQAQKLEAKATPDDARVFVDKLNKDLHRLYADWQRVEWIKDTYITDDTETAAARVEEEVQAYTAQAIKDAAKFDGVALDPDTERQLKLLKLSLAAPAPNDPQKREELAAISAKMSGMYGKGKYCPEGQGPEKCKDLGALSKILAESRDYDDELEAWKGWHAISTDMRPMFIRYAELANEGAREYGFKDAG